jgi:alkanesulfonate monooxygenase SsuD/methylene tetrahydromethanopterin reductase-like flavin-dependent oxidoreductase (luciferase family)
LRYGLALPTGGECGDPRFLVELAVLAEETGWDGIFLEDYLWYQGDPRIPTCDTWVALAAIAVRTHRVRLGTQVTPLSRRRPWKVAREAAGVDQLSGGRMILGVGLGDDQDPGFALGEETDPRRRAELLDDALDTIARLWSGEPVDVHGVELTFLPRPVQEPRIPIWIGGGYPSRGPVERALRWDGSCLYRREWLSDMPPEDVAELRRLAGERPFDISVGGRRRRPNWDEERDHIREVAAAGATWWSEYVPPASRATMRAAVARGPLRVD